MLLMREEQDNFDRKCPPVLKALYRTINGYLSKGLQISKISLGRVINMVVHPTLINRFKFAVNGNR